MIVTSVSNRLSPSTSSSAGLSSPPGLKRKIGYLKILNNTYNELCYNINFN